MHRFATMAGRFAALAIALIMPAQAQAAGPFFGINAGGLFSQSDSATRGALDQLREAGISEVRIDMSWGGIEKTPGTYDWTSMDRIVTLLAQSELRLFPMLGYSTAWSGTVPGDFFSGPRDVNEYAAFAGAAVRRYGPEGAFWAEHPELPRETVRRYEIWNEANSPHFWHDPSATRFGELYAAARAAIHAAHPKARAVVGGLVAWNAPSFLKRFYATSGPVDAVGYHTYAQGGRMMLQSVRRVRQTLNRLDPGVPIELTEFGLSQIAMGELRRAREFAWVVTQFAQRPRLHVASVMPFSMIAAEGGPSWDQWLGLFNRDGTPKFAGVSYLATVSSLLNR